MIGRLNEIVAENTKMVSNIDNIINISLNINTDIIKAAISALSQRLRDVNEMLEIHVESRCSRHSDVAPPILFSCKP